MPMNSKSMPSEPIEQVPQPVIRPKKTITDKIIASGVKTAFYRNDNKEPIGVRLDSLAPLDSTGRRRSNEWIWLEEGDEAKIPVSDIRQEHKLTLLSK